MEKIKRVVFAVACVLLVIVIVALLVRMFATTLLFSKHYSDDIRIESPDGTYELLIREWEALGGGGAEVYYIKGREQVQIGDTSEKSGCYAFRDGHYLIEWEEDYVLIKHPSGRHIETNDPDTWKQCKCEFPK